MSLSIKSTVKTPHIEFDTNNGLIAISGISIPEDPQVFFTPFNDALKSYIDSPSEKTLLEFRLEYFNTSTTLVIRNIIRTLSNISNKTNLKVKWFYENDDEDMEEAGQEFKMLFNEIKFDIIGVNEFSN